MMREFLGVLGGMGPLATVDFMEKVVRSTHAHCDQQHLPMIVYSHPQIPDRSASILNGGVSPLAALAEGVMSLERSGVGCIVMPCNTAHFWYSDLAAISSVPVLHIVDSVCDELDRLGGLTDQVGVMATEGTLAAKIYETRLALHGIECLVPSKAIQDRFVSSCIGAVKSGQVDLARKLIVPALDDLFEQGASSVVLACTELPLAFSDVEYRSMSVVDSTGALARAAVGWHKNSFHRPDDSPSKGIQNHVPYPLKSTICQTAPIAIDL